MVTHDQAEALAMADRVVVMDKGYIAQVGTSNLPELMSLLLSRFI